jgi:uncharacterized surface protein with fasciclin (FAS1) repeats
MKTRYALFAFVLLAGCNTREPAGATAATAAQETSAPAVEAPRNVRPLDETNIVTLASGSKDHTTLVAALKAADYVESVSNPGPFTVFAPVDAAFAKLPKETLDGLMKPEKKEDLRSVLKYHVAVSTYQLKDFRDGQVLAMANGGKVTFRVKDGKVTVNGAKILASLPASNGIIHVVDEVLLPPTS